MKQQEDGFVIALEIGGNKNNRGLSVDEFVKLSKIVTARNGKDVLISQPDNKGHMRLTKPGHFLDPQYLGYVDVNTGSLVWEGCGS
jgi:hypothetical protein